MLFVVVLVRPCFLTLSAVELILQRQIARAEVLRHDELQRVLATQNNDIALALDDDCLYYISQFCGFFAVDGENLILLPEAFALQNLGIIETRSDITQWQRVLPPMPEQKDEDSYRAKEINEDTAENNQQPLPSRFGTELPFLRLGRKVTRFVCLVHHAGYGTIAAERQPSYAPLRVLGMFFPLLVLILGKALEMPFAVELLHSEETEPRVEKEIELLHAYVEYLRESEMPQLMYQHEE